MSFFKELKRRNVVRVGIAYTVATWLLIQVTDTVFPRIGLPESAVTLVIALLFIGFIPALIFAWAFEMTPDGIKREKDVDRSQSIAPTTGRKLDRMIIGILTVTVAYLLIDKLVLQEAPTPVAVEVTQTAEPEAEIVVESIPSIAVLPFVNMSGDKDNEYFSDGLTETLLHMLTQIPGLRVAARTSSFAFKGQNASIQDIATALSVAHILEGSVQKSGNRVRITAQLIRADDGFHVWSQSYDRTLEDIFAIQDEIAKDVADALDDSLLGNSSPDLHGVSTSNLTAYESYLKGLEQQALFSYGSLTIAESHFKDGLAQDPRFTDARVALIRNYLLKLGTGVIEVDEVQELVEPIIRQVNEQDPGNQLARAYELLLYISASRYQSGKGELDAVLDELHGLLALMPTDSFIRITMSYPIAYFYRQHQQAIDLLDAGLLIDPLASDLYLQKARVYRDADRLDEAREANNKARELEPGSPNAYSQMGQLEEESNNLPAALNWYRRAMEVDPQDHELAAQVAMYLYDLKLPEEGDYWYAKVTALAPGSAVARLTELERAVARNEPEQVLRLASSMISDQIDMRDGAFEIANVEYAMLMLRTGRAREANDFLAAVRPDISNYDEMPADPQGESMQYFSILLMTGYATSETRLLAWQTFTSNWDKKGYPWRHPKSIDLLLDRIFHGDTEGAVKQWLQFQHLQSVASTLWWKRESQGVLFQELRSDPRVSASINEFNQEFAQIREQVQQLLQEPEWNQ